MLHRIFLYIGVLMIYDNVYNIRKYLINDVKMIIIINCKSLMLLELIFIYVDISKLINIIVE